MQSTHVFLFPHPPSTMYVLSFSQLINTKRQPVKLSKLFAMVYVAYPYRLYHFLIVKLYKYFEFL